MQANLYKALKEQNQAECKLIINSILTSFSARAIAVKNVISNKGKNTAGVDNIIFSNDEQKYFMIDKLKNIRKGYKASPIKRV